MSPASGLDAGVERIAAFSDGAAGGNPAGVWLGIALPDAPAMARIAHAVGYSETAFAAPEGEGWRVRYFSPESEVPFCGHATIALGAALARRHGDGVYRLRLNDAAITVEGRRQPGEPGASPSASPGASPGAPLTWAALQSPPTRSAPAPLLLVEQALALFGYQPGDLDLRLAPALAHGGADHLVLALHSRALLAAMAYDLDAGRRWMRANALVTVVLVWAETASRLHVRNPFASGGVYEDPATGAAAAALAGYLRDCGWPHGGKIELIQGEDMGMRSRLQAEIGPQPGSSIRVAGTARPIGQEGA